MLNSALIVAMEMPRIVIDARMIGPQGHGIAGYLEDIVAGLRKLQEKKPLPYELYFLVSPELPENHFLRHYPFEVVSTPFLSLKESLVLPKILKRLNANLYFTPSFSSLKNYPCPHVQTIHDLNHLHFAGPFHKFYYRLLVRPSAIGAATLFSVSDTARKEIKDWLGVEKAIELTWNAVRMPKPVNEAEEMEIFLRFGVEKEKYFFCLSNPKPHKNLEFLESAYRSFAKQEKNAYPLLLSIPGKSFGGVRKIGSLQQKEVSVLLKNSAAFFFPSLYEGFGRPPLEAAIWERVIIASDIPVIQEALSLLTPLEKLLLDPRKEALWVDAFQKAQKGELKAVSAEGREKILSTYAVEPLAIVVDAAFRRCHS